MICITVRENDIYFWLTPTFSFTHFDQHLLQSCVTPRNLSFDSQMLSPLKVVGDSCNAVTWEQDSKKWDCIDQLLMYTSRIMQHKKSVIHVEIAITKPKEHHGSYNLHVVLVRKRSMNTELMINHIIWVEFVLIIIFTQAGALKITIS